MAYSRNPSSGGASNSRAPAARAPAPAPAQPARGGGGGGGDKPEFRFALQEQVDGKWVTVKGEDGKTFIVGAAWLNKFGGLNVKIEEDIPAGARLIGYHKDDAGPAKR